MFHVNTEQVLSAILEDFVSRLSLYIGYSTDNIVTACVGWGSSRSHLVPLLLLPFATNGSPSPTSDGLPAATRENDRRHPTTLD